MQLSKRHIVLCLAVALTSLFAIHSAHAYPFPYVEVVCRDDRAAVFFTFADNDTPPDFRNAGSTWGTTAQRPPISGDLVDLKPDDPSHCRLRDGREVVVKQGDLLDARAYGECGADMTQTFSLWIGGDKIYSREIWHHKCGFPYEFRGIALDNSQL